MSDNILAPDPLSCAIAEFREDLLVWIETELARVREQAEELAGAEELSGASGSQLSASPSRVGASRGSPLFQPEIAAREPRTQKRGADRDSFAEAPRRSAAVSKLRIDPESVTPHSNSRQRLDALARLLDSRLKHPQGASETSSGAGNGPSAGTETDTP
jgi:hypothetical protein